MAIKVSKPKREPPMLLIAGDAGTGKTTLAAALMQWGNVVFIHAEPLTGVFDDMAEADQPDIMDQLPRADKKNTQATSNAILDQIYSLVDEAHEYDVLVIDAITTLSDLFTAEIMQHHKGDNMATVGGGYGAGYQMLEGLHSEVIAACLELRAKRDMVIVFLAHSSAQKLANRPDAEEAIVFGLDMHANSAKQYIRNMDAVLFCRIDTYTKGVQTDGKGNVRKAGKLITTGSRSIVTSGDAAQGYVFAKNRYGMPPEIDFAAGDCPLLDHISYFKS
jgi:hypothetical protein